MKKLYSEPVLEIELFQAEDIMGISKDDPSEPIVDPFE